MKIGYIRVSTQEQNTIRQEALMESLGVDEVYIDRMSGKNAGRPELRRMLEYVRKGDTVIVQRGGICVPEGVHRHHHAHWEIHAHGIWSCGGAGAGVYPAAPTGGH